MLFHHESQWGSIIALNGEVGVTQVNNILHVTSGVKYCGTLSTLLDLW